MSRSFLDTEKFQGNLITARGLAYSQGRTLNEDAYRAYVEHHSAPHAGISWRTFNDNSLEPGVFEQFLTDPAPPPPPPPDPIATALDQLANIFKPAPPPPSPPAPVRQSVGPATTSVERRRVDFGGFAAAVSAPSGSDFSKRRPTLGAGI